MPRPAPSAAGAALLRHSRVALGTALLAPPGLSERTHSLLRQAFTQAMRDPALPGAELQRVVDATFAIAPDVLERARKLSPQQ
jgi:hypothetical protein